MWYLVAVRWSDGQGEGFALAAAVCEDGGAAQAAAGLCEELRPKATAVARGLAQAGRVARRRWIRERLRRAVVPAAQQHGRPARALSLLAQRAPRELRQQWLHGAELPRAGFVPEVALIELLCRIAARPASAPAGDGTGGG